MKEGRNCGAPAFFRLRMVMIKEVSRVKLAMASLHSKLKGGIALLSKLDDQEGRRIFERQKEELSESMRVFDIAVAIAETGDTTSLHIAMEAIHDSCIWLAAFCTLRWYHSLDADIILIFRELADDTEKLLFDFDAARSALPIVSTCTPSRDQLN